MTKSQAEGFKGFVRWPKVLKSMPWRANNGTTMQGVRKERSPILRGQVLPNPLTQPSLKDVLEVKEVSEQAILYRHKFRSQMMHFLPNFQDFLTDHVTATNEDIVEKISVFSDLFYRTAVFHASPKAWLCGKAVEVTDVDHYKGSAIQLVKNQAVLQALTAQVTEPFDLAAANKLRTVMYNDLGIEPYSGNILADGTNGDGLRHKFCLIMGTEVWDSFHTDPFILTNKTDSLNLTTDSFTGSLFGRFTALFERYEMRINADGTVPAPEVLQGNPDAYNEGEVEPNPNYVNAKFGVLFACGADAYKSISVGPPPAEWTSMKMKEFANLNWNGKVSMTQNLLIPCFDENGNLTWETNSDGEFLRLQASMTYGILPVKRRNILPIIYLRDRGSV